VPRYQINYRNAITEAIREEMRRDDSVFLMGEDVGAIGGTFGTTKGLLQEFGEERVMDTPISEAAIVGFGVGAAMVGMQPIVEIMRIDFITTCMDEIVNQAAKMRYLSAGRLEVPIVIKTSSGGGLGLGAQHSQSFESWFASVPGLKLVVPSTPYDAKGLLKAAIRDHNPVIFVESVGCLNVTGIVPEEDYTLPIGKADIKRSGTDVTIAAWGSLVHEALNAADKLAEEGTEVEVVDLRSLSPLDIASVTDSVRKTGKLIIAHEEIESCGVGAEIATLVQQQAFDYLDAPVCRVAGGFGIFPVNRKLESLLMPKEEAIIRAVQSLLRQV